MASVFVRLEELQECGLPIGVRARGKKLAPELLLLPLAPVSKIQKHRVQFAGINTSGVPTDVEVPRCRLVGNETSIQEDALAAGPLQRIDRPAKSFE